MQIFSRSVRSQLTNQLCCCSCGIVAIALTLALSAFAFDFLERSEGSRIFVFCAFPLSQHKAPVVLSEPSRSLMARGAAEGPAVAISVLTTRQTLPNTPMAGHVQEITAILA